MSPLLMLQQSDLFQIFSNVYAHRQTERRKVEDKHS